jgi:hypothetical protein
MRHRRVNGSHGGVGSSFHSCIYAAAERYQVIFAPGDFIQLMQSRGKNKILMIEFRHILKTFIARR